MDQVLSTYLVDRETNELLDKLVAETGLAAVHVLRNAVKYYDRQIESKGIFAVLGLTGKSKNMLVRNFDSLPAVAIFNERIKDIFGMGPERAHEIAAMLKDLGYDLTSTTWEQYL